MYKRYFNIFNLLDSLKCLSLLTSQFEQGKFYNGKKKIIRKTTIVKKKLNTRVIEIIFSGIFAI